MMYVGLDLGQSNDYTAIAVVERITGKAVDPGKSHNLTDIERAGLRWMFQDIAVVPEPPTAPPVHHLRHLERLPLGTSYPAVVERVLRLVRLPSLREVMLAVDATGVGAPVVDLLLAAPLPCALYAIHIHGGDTVSHEGIHFRVPKRDPIATTQVLLQSGRFKIAQGLPEAATLVNELQNYRVKLDPATAHDSYNARGGAHDDVLLATCMALWLGETIGEGPRIRAL